MGKAFYVFVQMRIEADDAEGAEEIARAGLTEADHLVVEEWEITGTAPAPDEG